MDDVRALLAVLPDSPLPTETDVEHADAVIIVFPQDEGDYSAAAERVAAAIELGRPVYVVTPPLDSGLARTYLQSALQPGVYGVAVQGAASVDQLRYLEGVLEELEIRAGIRPGLTAMAVGFHDSRAINIMSDALAAMRDSADRMTWIAFNHVEMAESLGVQPDSPTVAAAGAQVVMTAAAFDLPVVYGSPPDAEYAASLGFRGCATGDPEDLAVLRAVFTRAEAEDGEQEEES
ncbi:MAG: hypothetical protein OXH13_12480 [Chloroflexi bacterium]|nr:hypothetical protein [Chloroflexota bacterium]MCY3695751.1 hypothetical protein [Chloroflexota bacterium]